MRLWTNTVVRVHMNSLWGSDLKLIIESIELNLLTKTDKAEIEILKELVQRAKSALSKQDLI